MLNHSDDPVCVRIYKQALKSLEGVKYMYFDSGLIGCLSYTFRYARVPVINPIPEKYIDAFLDAYYWEFHGGCEPEFESDEQYDRFQTAVKRMYEEIVWSTPKYSEDLNDFLFPNGCEKVPALCNVHQITAQIEKLEKNKDNTFSRDYWGKKHKTYKEMYDEFWGNI